MANRLFWTQVNRVFNADGTPADGAKAYFFLNRTTTQLTVYADEAFATALAQPVLADAYGVFPTVYTSSADGMRVVIHDKNNVPIPGYEDMNDVYPFSDVTNAASIAFSPTEDIPETTVQAAIEAAGALSTDQTATGQRSLTAWTTGGSGNAFTITPTPAITGYGAHQAFLVVPNRDNTAAATINVNAQGARGWQKLNPSGAVTPMAASDISQGRPHLVVYDGTRFVTILGGPIEATTIGAAEAASGAFTSLSADGLIFGNLTDAYATTGAAGRIQYTVGAGNPTGATGNLIIQSTPTLSRGILFVTGTTPTVRASIDSAGVNGAIGGTTPAAGAFTSVSVPAGAATTPVIFPAGDTNCGFAFPTGGDKITAVTAGVERFRIDDTELTSTLRLRMPTGSNVAPILSPAGDANTGIAFPTGANKITAVAGGAEITRWTTGEFIVGGNTTAIDPAAAQFGVSASIGGELVVSRNNAAPVAIKRGSDGTLVTFYSGTTAQGSISVSGTTVTYGSFCAVHWSQGALAEDIPPGTILESLNEMCVWDAEADDRLPKVALAAEASKAVYGVFFRWDDDGSDDLYIASAGALYVRMAPGETPARGDLVECAGAGLGRVQADDVMRSSTVAKITAAIAVETYGDGSKLYPATLHCG